MILAEGLLIGLVACLLSLSFGVMAGLCGTGISQYVSFFGGLATPLAIPWGRLDGRPFRYAWFVSCCFLVAGRSDRPC